MKERRGEEGNLGKGVLRTVIILTFASPLSGKWWFKSETWYT